MGPKWANLNLRSLTPSSLGTQQTRRVELDRLPNVDKVMETNDHVDTPNMVLATQELSPGYVLKGSCISRWISHWISSWTSNSSLTLTW